jgi:ribonuclease-3
VPQLLDSLGYVFQDPALLDRAITHRSYANVHNERLEFLGDAVIGFVVAEALFRQQQGADEGDLSRLRASLVREGALAEIARTLDLGAALKLGEGELKSGGWRRDSVLADALEAVIGAVFIDGGYEAARAVCQRLFDPLLAQLPDPESLKDPKTRLQEWLQSDNRPLPVYEVLSESGPAHKRVIEVRVRLADGPEIAEATAASRRAAEQKAAEALYTQLLESPSAHA